MVYGNQLYWENDKYMYDNSNNFITYRCPCTNNSKAAAHDKTRDSLDTSSNYNIDHFSLPIVTILWLHKNITCNMFQWSIAYRKLGKKKFLYQTYHHWNTHPHVFIYWGPHLHMDSYMLAGILWDQYCIPSFLYILSFTITFSINIHKGCSYRCMLKNNPVLLYSTYACSQII